MYDLHQLGWNGFQQLCSTILREILGQTVQSFLDTNDGGRDGAFAGIWKPIGGEQLRGQFVAQCKFTSRRGYSLCASDLSEELPKINRLVVQGRRGCYMLLTNTGLSGTHEREIEALVKKAGAKHVLLLGATWIEQQIREQKRLRMLVPRVYGLGDLSQILDERAYRQARAILESLRDDLAKVVVTDAYRRASAAMDEHGFVLVIGDGSRRSAAFWGVAKCGTASVRSRLPSPARRYATPRICDCRVAKTPLIPSRRTTAAASDARRATLDGSISWSSHRYRYRCPDASWREISGVFYRAQLTKMPIASLPRLNPVKIIECVRV